MYRAICLAGLLGLFGNGKAVEIETTWRTGDAVLVAVICQTLEDAENLALLFSRELDSIPEVQCLVAEKSPFGIAYISKWESGPYDEDEQAFSVWQISRGDNVAWTLLRDEHGDHTPAVPI